MADLKRLSIQLQQKCSEPCKDTVEIQTITGAGKMFYNSFTLRSFPCNIKFLSRASYVLVQHLVTDQNQYGASVQSKQTVLDVGCCEQMQKNLISVLIHNEKQ